MTDPRRALVVVDVQQEYFDGILQVQAPDRDQTLANVLVALDVAHEHGLPVVVVQHELPEGAPVFAVGSDSWSLHPSVEERLQPSWKRVTKDRSSVFAGTDVAAWLAEQGVDTITIVGYMTNNCDLATAVGAEELGLAAEIAVGRQRRHPPGQRGRQGLRRRPAPGVARAAPLQLRGRGHHGELGRGPRQGRGAPQERPRHVGDAGAGRVRRLTGVGLGQRRKRRTSGTKRSWCWNTPPWPASG
jgi:nicotinamidase-related amidase